MVSGSISLRYSRFFSPFPVTILVVSVSQEYLALADGPAKFTQGFKASYLLGGKFNYESTTLGNGSENIKNVLNKFQYGVYVSFGFNTWNPYIYYGLNPIFDKDKTAVENNVTALNIGLKFYIL